MSWPVRGRSAAAALGGALGAIRQTVWSTRRVSLPVIAGEHHTDRVVIVIVTSTVRTLEQFHLEVYKIMYSYGEG